MFSVMKLTRCAGGQDDGTRIWPVGDTIRGPDALGSVRGKVGKYTITPMQIGVTI